MKAIGTSHAFVWLAGLLVAGSIAAYTGAVAVARELDSADVASAVWMVLWTNGGVWQTAQIQIP